jgi:hypothetical protein
VSSRENKENAVSKAPPPVPPANRNSKAPGESEVAGKSKDQTPVDSGQALNPDQKGQAANTKQNTTHQGYQQDR